MEYRDFTLKLQEGELQSPNVQEIHVRWRFGSQSGLARTELPPGIEDLSARVLGHLYEPLPDGIVEHLSEQLTSLLLSNDVGEAFCAADAECQRGSQRLRLRIIAEDERLVRLPFEFMRHPDGRDPLLLNPFYSLVRSVNESLVPLEPVGEDRPLRVLLVGASPHAENLAWIDTEAETVLIRGALRPLAQQKWVTVQVLLQATPEQLQGTLFENMKRGEPFDLVHLTFHTINRGEGVEFALEGERGLPAYVPVQVVGKWLRGAGVPVVVVDGCDVATTLGPWLAKAGMPAAVVMQGGVSDAPTTEFTHNLYRFLADLLPLDAAISLGRRLQFEHMQFRPDWGAPVFYLQAAASFLFRPLKTLFLGSPEEPPEQPKKPLDWDAIVTLAASGETVQRVRACQELVAFYEREYDRMVADQPGLPQQLSGPAAKAVQRLLQLAHSDSSEEVRGAARLVLQRRLRPSHFDQLFDRFVGELVSTDPNVRLCAEEILKQRPEQFDRALVATIRSRIHWGSTCFAGRKNRIEVRLETDYPGEIRLRCEFGPRYEEEREAETMGIQDVLLDGSRRRTEPLLYDVTPSKPKDFDFWVTLRKDGYAAPPIIHRIHCQPLNPYQPFGNGLDNPVMFYGREKDLREVVLGARQQNRTVIGERRIGKTSFLQAVARQLGAPLIPVMLGVRNEGGLFRDIVLEAYTAASSRVSELPPPLAQSMSAPVAYDFNQAKSDMTRIIERLRRDYASDAKFVLLIDEGDRLFFDFDDATRRDLRFLLGDLHLSAIIACVRRPERADDSSSLFNIFLPLRLRPLTVEQTRSLIRKPVAEVLEFLDEAVEFIVKKTQGRPAFVQNICFYAVERVHERSQQQITLADVEAVYRERLLIPDFAAFREAWKQLSPAVQKQLLESLDEGQLPPLSLQALRNLSMIEEIDVKPRLPVVFADWLKEGKRGSWLTLTS